MVRAVARVVRDSVAAATAWAAAAAAAAREAAVGGWLWVSVVNLVWFVDLVVEQDGLEEPEHGGEEAHHLGLLDNRRRGVAQPGHRGQGENDEQMRHSAQTAPGWAAHKTQTPSELFEPIITLCKLAPFWRQRMQSVLDSRNNIRCTIRSVASQVWRRKLALFWRHRAA